MADAHAKPHHDYHLVDPSPWPAIGAVSAFLLAVGAITWMHHMFAAAPWIFAAGTLGTLYTMLGWWRDVAREATFEGHHTRVVQISHRYGMILFIASEVMFFVAWFWAWFDASLFPSAAESIGGVWPPHGMRVLDPFGFPLLNTLILLCSGCTVTWAHHALINGHRDGLIKGLWLTIALGIMFTSIQAYEYSHAPFGFKDNIYTSAFFMATGFHGFHVIVGTIFLTVCLVRAYKGHFTPQQHFGFEAAAWYWHFVDVVWLFLFLCVYVWGGWGASYAG
jgi:cytochrome c oxidase subunit 3